VRPTSGLAGQSIAHEAQSYVVELPASGSIAGTLGHGYAAKNTPGAVWATVAGGTMPKPTSSASTSIAATSPRVSQAMAIALVHQVPSTMTWFIGCPVLFATHTQPLPLQRRHVLWWCVVSVGIRRILINSDHRNQVISVPSGSGTLAGIILE
jgi:hypothetical protein